MTKPYKSQNLSTHEKSLKTKISVYPNPSASLLTISGLENVTAYKVFNHLGSEVKNGKISSSQYIDIKNLSVGLYFLKLKSKPAVKFIKQ